MDELQPFQMAIDALNGVAAEPVLRPGSMFLYIPLVLTYTALFGNHTDTISQNDIKQDLVLQKYEVVLDLSGLRPDRLDYAYFRDDFEEYMDEVDQAPLPATPPRDLEVLPETLESPPVPKRLSYDGYWPDNQLAASQENDKWFW